MGYPLRYVPEGGALVEITINTIQGRYLLRPDKRGRVNELILGIVGRAQRLYSMSLVGISVLSSHAHILAVPDDAEQLSAFMRHVDTNLSKAIEVAPSTGNFAIIIGFRWFDRDFRMNQF